MTVNFPKNPPLNLTWLDPSNSVTYTWDGVKWLSTGTGVSFTTVIFNVDNDDPDLIGVTTSLAINAALIANGQITAVGNLRPGNTLLVNDTGNPDANPNVFVGQYLYDGVAWQRTPTPGAPVISVFGRIGSIVATNGDYNIGQMSNVDLTSPTPTATANSLLRFNGTTYVPGEARNTPTCNLPLTKTGSDVLPTLGFNIDGLSILP